MSARSVASHFHLLKPGSLRSAAQSREPPEGAPWSLQTTPTGTPDKISFPVSDTPVSISAAAGDVNDVVEIDEEKRLRPHSLNREIDISNENVGAGVDVNEVRIGSRLDICPVQVRPVPSRSAIILRHGKNVRRPLAGRAPSKAWRSGRDVPGEGHYWERGALRPKTTA
jgi:hypothetical protein